MTITYDKQVLIKRGNTASISTYVGPLGELVLDTDTNLVYVHDGVTAGGHAVSGNVTVDGTNYSNTNVAAYLTSSGYATQSYVDAKITANISAIIDSAPGALDTLNELAAALGDDASFSTTLTNSLANVNANVSALQSQVDGLTSYANANVASYLTSYNGNIAVDYVTFQDQSEQYTAWPGAEWRSSLTSDLTVKPSWMYYYPGGDKLINGTSFGFDAQGMWFAGNANYPAYPIRTNVGFHQDDKVEVVATIHFEHQGDDQSIAVFNSNVDPQFTYSTNSTRIAFNSNFGIPVLYGRTTANTAPGSPVFAAGNWYTIKFVYDPQATPSVTVSSYAGNAAVGSPIDVRSIDDRLPAGIYTVGFDGDQDQIGQKAHFTHLTIRTLNDTVTDDLEVTGYINGNLIPSANVTYSLGNETHQWKELWVSNTTIYMNSVPLSLGADNTLLVNNTPVVTYVNGSLSVGGNVVNGGNGLPTVTIPAEQGTTYKGLQVSYGVVHSNGSTTEYNVNKIVIHKPAAVTLDIDPTSSSDYFRVSGLGNSDILAMFVLYGDTNGAKPLSELQAFAEAVIDNVILDGGVEGDYNTVAVMKSNFYGNFQTLLSAAGGLYANFEFYDSTTPTSTGITTVRQGTGATFSVTVAIPGEAYATASQFEFGTNYRVGHKVKLSGADLGGTTPENDVTITVTSVDGVGGITGVSFEGTSNAGASPGTIYNGISGTNFDVGSNFNVSGVNFNVDGTFSSLNIANYGSNYVVGDVLALSGTDLLNGASPDNDATITVVSVDGLGSITDFTVAGTFPRSWRTNSISDGGADQYDTANYINTFYATNIEYNQGQTVANGAAAFGQGSSYSFVYQSSIFGLLATGNQSSYIETNGNSGADGSSTTETGSIYGPDIASRTVTNAVTHINLIGDTWTGPIVSFTRPDNSDQTIDILIADDGSGAGVAIARSSNGNGIFNPYREEGWSNNTSPAGTLWNTDGWADLKDVTTRTYQNLYAAFGSGGLGNKIVGTECVMYLPDNGKYYAVKFSAWTQNNNGGGFAYTRREIDLNSLEEGITFADGTKLSSASGLGRVKSTAPGNRTIEEVTGYNTVSVTARQTSVITFTASKTETNSQWFWFDNTTTTVDDIINNYPSYQIANISDMQFSVDGVTYYAWNGSGTTDINNQSGYSVFPNSVSYNQGDTLYFRYTHGAQPVVWWDKADLPGGTQYFRGAIIEYHAFTGQATWIGTIHIVDDTGNQYITHTEVNSGSTDAENDDLWLVGNEGTISYRRIDFEEKTLKIHWTAKVFYGSEIWD